MMGCGADALFILRIRRSSLEYGETEFGFGDASSSRVDAVRVPLCVTQLKHIREPLIVLLKLKVTLNEQIIPFGILIHSSETALMLNTLCR